MWGENQTVVPDSKNPGLIEPKELVDDWLERRKNVNKIDINFH